MRASDKMKVRQRRFAHVALILISFSLMLVGKADLVVLRDARMGGNDFLAPVIDFVSAPIRGVETMADGFARLHRYVRKMSGCKQKMICCNVGVDGQKFWKVKTSNCVV